MSAHIWPIPIGSATRLAGDASTRVFSRVTHGKASYILMDCSSEAGGSIEPFQHASRFMRESGICAPEVFVADHARKLLLVEDLGETGIAETISKGTDPADIYQTASLLLGTLHGAGLPAPNESGLDEFGHLSATLLTEELDVFLDWFVPVLARRKPTPAERDAFTQLWRELLKGVDADQKVLLHRDFHSGNFIWRPERKGSDRLGVVDIQDAIIGHPAYDVVSLIQDVRRDVAPSLQSHVIDVYRRRRAWKASEFADFENALKILGVQRTLRVLGVCVRLSQRDGKSKYLLDIPRQWRRALLDFERPMFRPLAAWISDVAQTELDLISQ